MSRNSHQFYVTDLVFVLAEDGQFLNFLPLAKPDSYSESEQNHEFSVLRLICLFKSQYLQLRCVNRTVISQSTSEAKGLFGATYDTAAAATFSSTFEPSLNI